jgi:hypothetical protein
MGDLTRTFGGLIILAHRVNSQSLYVIASIYTYILDMYVYKYIITYIYYIILLYIIMMMMINENENEILNK